MAFWFPYLASDTQPSWLFCLFPEQNLYCNSRLLWQMWSLPQPLFIKVICQKQQSRIGEFAVSDALTQTDTFLKRLYLRDGPLLLEQVEDRSNVGQICTRPGCLTGIPQGHTDWDGDSAQPVLNITLEEKGFVVVFFRTVESWKVSLHKVTVPGVGVWRRCTFLSSVQAASVVLWANPEIPLWEEALLFSSRHQPPKYSWVLWREKQWCVSALGTSVPIITASTATSFFYTAVTINASTLTAAVGKGTYIIYEVF